VQELFVYYRVRGADSAAAQQAVTALHARLRQQFPRLVARLLCRAEVSGEDPTWMETYAMGPREDAAGITAEIQQAIEAEARTLVQPLVVGTRHVEVFEPCFTSS
jgi:hypothetical protein